MKKNIIIALVVIAVVVVCLCLILCSHKKQEISFETVAAKKENIANSVTATGTIEPVTSVDVGTQVSGTVAKLYVDYNSIVKKGQLIAELDKTNLISELNIAKANLNDAMSQLKYQTANYNRYKTLYQKGLVSADDFELAQLSYTQSQDAVKQQEESVQKAQTNLGYAIITSPIDGIVLSKEVEEGQTVAASFETPTLFTIAKDLTDMQVIADVDEADIGGVIDGDRVTFTVDAYPDDVFNGFVTQVRQEATTTNNVVTYEVVISAPNQDLKLKPGLTANVTIYTQEKNDVLTVPNKALRFTPTQELSKNIKIKDDAKGRKVWTLSNNEFVSHAVKTGITDGINTEILSGIKEGTKVVTEATASGSSEASSNQSSQTETSPFAPHRPNQNNNKK
ncbi:MAG: efflux RND transporter periplasmic adaptor subunit [Prevotella sp.]|nr:efflux RND transporter periplasmic adaptor subunit [Prevotella sp.]